MNFLTYQLLKRLARVLLDFMEYTLGGVRGRTPEEMLDDIRHIRKDYSL